MKQMIFRALKALYVLLTLTALAAVAVYFVKLLLEQVIIPPPSQSIYYPTGAAADPYTALGYRRKEDLLCIGISLMFLVLFQISTAIANWIYSGNLVSPIRVFFEDKVGQRK